MIIALLSLAMMQEVPLSQDKTTSMLLKDYSTCLLEAALILEPSGGSADDLFKAARTDCAGELVAAHYALQDRYAARGDAEAARLTLQIIDGVDGAAEDDVRLQILKVRAKRKK